jgi:hypothetical protein
MNRPDKGKINCSTERDSTPDSTPPDLKSSLSKPTSHPHSNGLSTPSTLPGSDAAPPTTDLSISTTTFLGIKRIATDLTTTFRLRLLCPGKRLAKDFFCLKISAYSFYP